MRRTFAGRLCPVVTAETGARDATVVEGCRNPAAGLVAVFAGVARCEVGRALAGGLGAIVAAEAGAGDATMVEGRRHPGRGLVAVFAGVAG